MSELRGKEIKCAPDCKATDEVKMIVGGAKVSTKISVVNFKGSRAAKQKQGGPTGGPPHPN